MPGASVDLSKVWLFSECSRSELKTIQKKTKQVAVAAGSVICDEGDVGQTFYYIISGRAAVLRNGRKTAELEDGGYFGELALLDRLPRSATVKAVTDMELLAIDQRDFNQLLKDSPSTVRKLLVATAARLRSSDTKALLASVH
ncbi:MAG TPA: cyclic nucleotide-binding domain-containing protein [Acidimicrobiales bacterium]|nr:cyclic nucleotide-binding domain-containing protein [Acidimicrobiales bacterium]